MESLRVLKPSLYSNALSTPAIAVFAFLLASPRFSQFARVNLLTQLAIFIPTVQIPALLTSRISYVDIGWPSGLFAMGVVTLVRTLKQIIQRPRAAGENWRAILASIAYMFQGGRMAFGAWTMFLNGHLRKEMQRYTYQRHRWSAAGILAGSFAEVIETQKEAFTQCWANLGPFCIPLVLNSAVPAGPIQFSDVVGWALWVSSFIWEHTSDLQKLAFGRSMKQQGLRKKVCDWGLWGYTRHPNYFGEWMVWVALTLASLSSYRRLLQKKSTIDDKEAKDDEESVSSLGATLSLVSVPVYMYICLVHWTGATPAEFYSMQNRPDYAQYCKEVNCFFPWFRSLPTK